MDKDLHYRFVPPQLIISDYVKGDEYCEYELYLREIINKSKFFLDLSDGEEYVCPQSENEREPDAVTKKYSIDFKLVESSSFLEARSVLSNQIDLLVPGVISISSARRRGKTIATYLNVLLREIRNIEEFVEIESSSAKHVHIFDRMPNNMEQQSISDVKNYLKILHTRKNLLLFLPRMFVLPEDRKPEGIQIITDALENDFGFSCLYRDEKFEAGEIWDTFFCCLYDDEFIFYQVVRGKFKMADRVKMEKSEIFMHLYNSYWNT